MLTNQRSVGISFCLNRSDVHQVFFAKQRDRDIILSVEWSPCKHLEKQMIRHSTSDELVLGYTPRFVHFCNACRRTVYVSDHRKSGQCLLLVRGDNAETTERIEMRKLETIIFRP